MAITELPPLSLYVHFPWCVQKCPYCDFNSHALKSEIPELDYVKALIKDLDVKGSSLTAKRGTAVRNIGLTSNPEHIEGRVDGQRIVILTKFVKK